MSENLVIVESPAKAKTLKKYLGRDFEVLASYGHVRDLVEKEGAVDPEHGFAMKYELIDKNRPRVDAIERAARKAHTLFLATDPDREGEAISWHLAEILRERGILEGRELKRVRFYEVTKNAIREALDHPEDLNDNLVNAQQARRALDYLVGFNLSPLLWRKIKPGLSAGRVQSVALRLICEREDEIAAFRRQEYWTVEARGVKDASRFPARLVEYRGDKVEVDTQKGRFSITSEEQAREVERTLVAAAAGSLVVARVERKPKRRNPAPPFTTSTLQQEAARKLGFTARRTMQAAQRLYEAGFITYMRTDSVSLSNDAVADIRDTIRATWGAQALSASVNVYRTRSKNAQEAHEAIRPTSAARNPRAGDAEIEDADQRRLYALVWQRAVACQMAPAATQPSPAMRATCSAPAARRCWKQASSPSTTRTTTRTSRSRARMNSACRRWPRASWSRSPSCCPSSTSRSRRRASPRRAWSRDSRTSASAGHPPMPRSSRRCAIAATSR